MRDEIRTFLVKNAADPGATDFGDSESLLESGVLDSVAMVDLVTHLEAEYGVTVGDAEATPENFDSVDSIVAFVESKRGA